MQKRKNETENIEGEIIMKKKMVGILSALLTIAMLGGCGEPKGSGETNVSEALGTSETSEKSETTTVLKDMDVEQYVTLGEYKQISVTVAPIEVKDEEVEQVARSLYLNAVTEENGVKDRAVALGDTVIIDYEGKQDGVAFAGGTAQGANLTIGSGQFIDGFEDGLIGVMPGETVDLNLTFPEQYHSAELAGAEVVFTVTVHYIIPEQMDDAVIAGMGIEGVTNAEELRKYVYDYMASYNEQTYNSNKESAVLTAFMDGCVFGELPEEVIAKYETLATEIVNQAATNAGMTPDDYTLTYYNMDFNSFVKEYAKEATMQNLAMQAVANKESLNVDDAEIESMLAEQLTLTGYATEEEYLGNSTKEDFREGIMYDKVFNYLVENAIVIE